MTLTGGFLISACLGFVWGIIYDYNKRLAFVAYALLFAALFVTTLAAEASGGAELDLLNVGISSIGFALGWGAGHLSYTQMWQREVRA